MKDRTFWLALAGLLAAYLALAAVLPPLDDELYYWCWAQDPQLSYFDHPPMTAYFIRVATGLFGDSLLATRLPACLASAAIVGVLASLMPRATRRVVWPGLVLTPFFSFGAVLITPDTPLLLAWTLYLRWLVAVQSRLDEGLDVRPAWWLLGGVILGLGALGKYTMALAVPAGFASFLLTPGPRSRWLWWYVAHGVVSFLAFLPVVVFNWQRDFEPILFQWCHAMAPVATKPGWKMAGEFTGVQVALVGVWPYTLFGWVLWQARPLVADAKLRVCACLYAIPFGFFIAKSFRGPLEGNWAMVSYLGLWPLAAHWLAAHCGPRWRPTVAALGFLIPAATVVGTGVHLLRPWPQYPPRIDRLSRQPIRVEVARQVAERLKAEGCTLPVYTPTYQWVALLRFHGVDARQMAGVSRPSHFTTRPDHLSDVDEALVWNEVPLLPELREGFGEPTLVAEYPVEVRGTPVTGYLLLHYRRATPSCPCPEAPPRFVPTATAGGLLLIADAPGKP